jgi:hypothetical protein
MCDFVCENLLSSRTICLKLRSGSQLERVKGIEPSFNWERPTKKHLDWV